MHIKYFSHITVYFAVQCDVDAICLARGKDIFFHKMQCNAKFPFGAMNCNGVKYNVVLFEFIIL